MTQDLALEIVGDCWYNFEKFKQDLYSLSHKPQIVIDTRSEGPCFSHLGVTDVIDQWLVNNQRSPTSVTIQRWSNPVEYVPYTKSNCSLTSHFFGMAQDYWHTNPQAVVDRTGGKFLYGFFVGRLNIARSVMLYEVGTQLNNCTLMSKMKSREHMPWDVDFSLYRAPESYLDWMPINQQIRMIRWFDTSCPDSIDGFTVQQQFETLNSYVTANRSILDHYHRFGIELVAETYCSGNTFFPTEKTVRPLMALKPMIVYGPRYYLSRLRDMGFNTWNHLWDESYDLLEGPQRWASIKTVLKHLSALNNNEQAQLLTAAQTVCERNRKKLLEVIGQSRTIKPWMINDSK